MILFYFLMFLFSVNAIIDRFRESADIPADRFANEFSNVASSLSQRKPIGVEPTIDHTSESVTHSNSRSFQSAAPFAFFTRARVTSPARASPAQSVFSLPHPTLLHSRPRSEASAEATAAACSDVSFTGGVGGRSLMRPIGDPRVSVSHREIVGRRSIALRLPGPSSSPVVSVSDTLSKRHPFFGLPARGRPSLQTMFLPVTARNPIPQPPQPPSTRFLERTTNFIEQADIDTLNSLLAVINTRKRRLQEVRFYFSSFMFLYISLDSPIYS